MTDNQDNPEDIRRHFQQIDPQDLAEMRWEQESAQAWEDLFRQHGIDRSEIIRQATRSRWQMFTDWLRTLVGRKQQ